MNRPYLVPRSSGKRRWRTIPFLAALLFAFIFLAPPLLAETIDQHLRAPEILLSAPCPASDNLLLPNRFYVVCYNTKWRIPYWVAYYLTAPDLEGDVDRTEDFREDKAIKMHALRSTLKDYRGSGYHRGHMAPAEAFDRSEIAMSTTFLLSNMAVGPEYSSCFPQVVVMQSMDSRELDDIALFGRMNGAAIGRIHF